MKQKVAEWLNVFFGMRKFIAWFALFVVGIVFRLKGYIDGSQFVDLMKATFAGFVAGNTVEHLVSFGKDFMASKASNSNSAGNQEVLVVPTEGDDSGK